MKKIASILFTAVAMFVSADSFAQFKLNMGKLAGAAADAATAVTISDEDVARLSKESVDWMDAHNPIADETTEYGARLKRLTEGLEEVDGVKLNFKVYHVVDVNAFACGDGSVRVFSSLMDIMDDDELMSIIGHEIGHVVHGDSKAAFKRAYLSSAAVKAASSAGGVAGKLSEGAMGDLVVAFTESQFSKSQEYDADKYGFDFIVARGFDPYASSRALQKLVDLAGGEKASVVAKMFSSHPDSEKRAAKLKEMADEHVANQQK